MLYFFYFIFFALNMIFFGIINIPLFRYFCDLPNLDYSFLIGEDLFFYKNYVLLLLDDYSIFYSNVSLFYIDFFLYFIAEDTYMFIFNSFYSSITHDFFFISYDYIEVFFQTSTSNFNFVEFCSLQKNIFIIPNETHLVFFRMYNSLMYEITGISIYLLYPTDYLVFFNKIQCFCFDELLFYPYESVDLPVVFFISNDILNHVDFFYSNKVYLSYLFLIRS